MRRQYRFLPLLLALFLVCARAWSQADQGAITGTVSDSSGAVVTLTDPSTGLQLKSTTDASGIFTFSPIKIGTYTVLASAPGFTATRQDNVHVDIQSRVAVPLTLKIGATTTVEGNAAPPLLQSQDSSVAQRRNEQQCAVKWPQLGLHRTAG